MAKKTLGRKKKRDRVNAKNPRNKKRGGRTSHNRYSIVSPKRWV